MTDTATATTDQLLTIARSAWRVAEYRTQADALEAGTHDLAPHVPLTARAATVAGMRAEADRIEALAAEAEAELDRRRAAAPVHYYDQHGRIVGTRKARS